MLDDNDKPIARVFHHDESGLGISVGVDTMKANVDRKDPTTILRVAFAFSSKPDDVFEATDGVYADSAYDKHWRMVSVSKSITRDDRVGIVRLTAEDVIRLFMRHNSFMPSRLSIIVIASLSRSSVIAFGYNFRFALSFRDVEELLAMRGVALSYETVREWCLKFGQIYANGLRRRSPRPGDQWHLDEVFLKINGRLHYLWRAVDQDGDVLDILVQSRRDKKAAKRFFR